MNQKRTFFTILVLLALSGIVIAILRHVTTGTPFLPGKEKSVWLVEARVEFEATGGPVSASLSLPDKQLRHVVPPYSVYTEEVLNLRLCSCLRYTSGW